MATNQEGSGVEIVPADVGSGGTTVVRIPDDPMAVLEARNRMMERLLNYAIAATHAGQWQMLGDKPWPTGPACEAMARRCAVSWDKPEAEKRDISDEAGPAYSWTYRSRFFLPGGLDSIWAEGHCSSRDQFLGTGATNNPRALPDVEEGNIRQAAMTNMVVNGVTRLLGVRNITQERLDALLGPGASEGMGKVQYRAGAKGGGQGQGSQDVDLKFGKGKGKKLSEVGDDDVRWYIGCWEKDLADPEKAKYHANSKRSIEIAQQLLASRANEKAGTTAPSAGAAPASPWQRIRALDPTISEPSLKEIVKVVTKKANASQLVEADIDLVRQALAERAAGTDIPF